MHGTLVPLTTLHSCQLPLLSHGEQQRDTESHLDGSSISLLRRILLLVRDANHFCSKFTFRFEKRALHRASAFVLDFTPSRRKAHFRVAITSGNSAHNRLASLHTASTKSSGSPYEPNSVM